MQSPYDWIDPAWLAPDPLIVNELEDDWVLPSTGNPAIGPGSDLVHPASVNVSSNNTKPQDFYGPLHNNFTDLSTAAYGCNIFSFTNGMVFPEQDQPSRDFYATYPGSEINEQPHGFATRTIGSFEVSQPEFLGDEEIESTTLAPENAGQLQEQDLVDSSRKNCRHDRSHRCHHPACSMSFDLVSNLERHERENHPNLFRCSDCGIECNSVGGLEWHASRMSHAAFLCPENGCNSTFNRTNVLRRHYLNHVADAQRYPCPHCKKYRGKNGFKRKDHLTQHLRGYHHIGEGENTRPADGRSCPHEDCFAYRGMVRKDGTGFFTRNHAFQKQSEWTAHMKGVHNESRFPCTIPGCDRTGGKGYFRRCDLRKHISKMHPNYSTES